MNTSSEEHIRSRMFWRSVARIVVSVAVLGPIAYFVIGPMLLYFRRDRQNRANSVHGHTRHPRRSIQSRAVGTVCK